MKNGPPEKKEGESIPRPRGEVSEYIYRTNEVLEEHAESESKARPALGIPKAPRLKMVWLIMAVLVVILIASLILFILNRR